MLGARMLKEPQKFVGAWNFGPEYSSIIPVQKLINLILKHWGSGTWEIQGESPKQHEAQLLALDTSKARYILGWNSILGVDEAVQETLKWYKFQLANKSQKDLYKLCKDQIFNYIKKMEEKNENY
jgi:CDP-glucose 4,6-dehydratase